MTIFLVSLRALLPELLTFAYIPANHLKFNGASQQPDLRKDIFSDYAAGARPTQYDEDEHVLVLEMDDNMVRKKKSRPPSDSQVSLGIGPVF
jgi:DEAD/DEAH box helicase domain-containing protein